MDTIEESRGIGGTTWTGQFERFDVLRYHGETYRAVPAGDGQEVVAAHESEARSRRIFGSLTVGLLPAVIGVVFRPVYLGPLGPRSGRTRRRRHRGRRPLSVPGPQ